MTSALVSAIFFEGTTTLFWIVETGQFWKLL
jgi:hypothetical protein